MSGACVNPTTVYLRLLESSPTSDKNA